MKRRYGRFSIPRAMIENDKASCLAIFSMCIVMRAEFMYCGACIEYQAYSESFDEIEEFSLIPEYQIVMTATNPDGTPFVTFVRQPKASS